MVVALTVVGGRPVQRHGQPNHCIVFSGSHGAMPGCREQCGGRESGVGARFKARRVRSAIVVAAVIVARRRWIVVAIVVARWRRTSLIIPWAVVICKRSQSKRMSTRSACTSRTRQRVGRATRERRRRCREGVTVECKPRPAYSEAVAVRARSGRRSVAAVGRVPRSVEGVGHGGSHHCPGRRNHPWAAADRLPCHLPAPHGDCSRCAASSPPPCSRCRAPPERRPPMQSQ